MVPTLLGSTSRPVAGLTKASRGDLLRVYIEGDGRAYITSTRPSTDPTPIDNVVFRLVAADSGNAAYLGRPCQFTSHGGCNVSDWTNNRFSQSNVDDLSSALNELKTIYSASKLELVGYSGGGVMALLLAASRQDVVQVQTIAGTLDPDAWTQILKLTPLSGSLNPTAFAHELASIPQRHIIGNHDRVVPPEVATSFLRKTKPSCAEVIETNSTHNSGFEGVWARVKDSPIRC